MAPRRTCFAPPALSQTRDRSRRGSPDAARLTVAWQMRVNAGGHATYVLPPVQPPPVGKRGGNGGGNRGGGGGGGGGVPGLPGQFVNAPPPGEAYMSGAAPPAQGVGPAPWLQIHQQKTVAAGSFGEPGGGYAPQQTTTQLDATLQGYQAQAAARQHARGNRPHFSGSALADATAGETARDGEEPPKKKERGKRGGRDHSDRDAEKRQRRAAGDGE